MPQKDTLYGDLFVVGSLEANLIKKTGGTSSQFLKADGSVDSNTYLTSVPTLDQVTTAGNTTTNAITVGDITSTGIIKSVVSSVTAQFTAYNPANNYPRAQFQVGQNSSDNNVGLTIAPLYSSTGVQKPVFIQVSTNKNVTDSGQFSGYFSINTSLFTIATNKQDGQVSGGVPIVFSPANTEAMRIQTNGNIGINTATDAGYKLDVNGTTRLNGDSYINGNLGIGVVTPLQELHLLGTFRSQAKTGSDNVFFEGVNSAGTIVAQMQEASSFGFGGLVFNGQRNNASGGNGVGFAGYIGSSGNNAAIEFRAAGGTISSPATHPTSVPIAKFCRLDTPTTLKDEFIIYGDGNIGINTTTNAGYKLDVNGTLRTFGHASNNTTRAFTVRSSDGFDKLYLNGDGSITMNGSTVLYSNGFSINAGGDVPFNIQSQSTVIIGRQSRFVTVDTGGTSYAYFNKSLLVGSNVAATSVFQVTGSITAASALAQGVYFNNTLVAAANNDVLVGLDINPTFTNGAFTGVTNYGFRFRNNGTLRTQIDQFGRQEWYLNSGSAEVGKIAYSTPNNFPGIVIWTGATYDQNRFNIVNNGTYFGFAYNADSLNQGRLNIFNGGVGIGTSTNAGYQLDVNGTFRANGILNNSGIINGNGNSTIGSFYTSFQLGSWDILGQPLAGNRLVIGGYQSSQWTNLSLHTNGAEAVRIDSSGNVGIGTSSPGNKLQVAGTTRSDKFLVIDTGNNSVFRIGASTSSEGGLYMRSGAASDGEIAGGVYFVGGFPYAAATGASAINFYAGDTYFTNNSGLTVGASFVPSTRMLLKANGNLLVGTTTDIGYTLNVNGTARVAGNTVVSGNMGIGSSAGIIAPTLYVYGAKGSFGTFSDTVAGFKSTGNTYISIDSDSGNDTGVQYVSNGVTNWVLLNSRSLGGFASYSTAFGYATLIKDNGNFLIGTTTDTGQKLQISGSIFIKGTTSLTATKIFEVQNGSGTSIMDFRDNQYAFFGCGQGGGSASGFIFNYSNTSYTQFSGYNYGAGAGSYKPILMDTDGGGRNQGIFVNFGVTTNTPPSSNTEFAVRGRTSDSSTYISKFVDSSNVERFSIRADGALFTDGNIGYTGTVNFPTNPPGQQNIDIVNGMIVNVF